MSDEQTQQVNEDMAPDDTEASAEPVIEEAPAEDAAAIDDELAAARAEAQKNLEGWQRARAEFANYKKRTERERLDTYENATIEVLKALIPIIEDFERALENIPEAIQEDPWVDGTAAIGRKLSRILETYEIDTIDPVGEPFDPDRHQGLGVDEDSDIESGHVSQTLQKGYIKGDRVIRHALVRVAG